MFQKQCMPPHGAKSLKKQNLSEASKKGIKIYKVDNTLG